MKGLALDLYVSNRNAGQQFSQQLATIAMRSFEDKRQYRQQEYERERQDDERQRQQQEAERQRQRQQQEAERQRQRQQQEAERQRQQKSSPPPPKTDLERAYALLYVQIGAPIEIAEAAYKTAMKKAHPDAGGTDEQARKLSWAIETIRRYRVS